MLVEAHSWGELLTQVPSESITSCSYRVLKVFQGELRRWWASKQSLRVQVESFPRVGATLASRDVFSLA